MPDRRYLEQMSKDLADKGLLIEAGWVGFRLAVIGKDASKQQLEEMKMCFFAGATHLFSSIMVVLDEDAEPTPEDERKLDLINEELKRFNHEFELRVAKSKGSA